MFKLTKGKFAVFLLLVGLTFGPALFIGSGMAVVLPVIEMFWLAALANGIGIDVTAGPGVDAFNLVPPNVAGFILIVIGLTVSLVVQYILVCVLSARFFKVSPAPR